MKIRKIFTYTLATSMLFANIVPAFATYKDSTADVEYTDVIEDKINNTTVYAEIGSKFEVTIPKHIILDGTLKKGEYLVTVKGDIAGNEEVNVIPDKNFALKSDNLADITASISQDKTAWSYNEILEENVLGNGAIDAKDMTAGSWNGNFNFNINLSEKAGIYDLNGNLLSTLEDLDMDVTKDYDSMSIYDDFTSPTNALSLIKASEIKIVIPYGTTKIGSHAFYDCDKLTEIVIPNTVTEIGTFAFNSSGLKEVTIPDSVTKINDHTFEYCSDLKTVTLGNNTQSIGKYAFSQCINLEKITMPENIEIGVGAFNNCFKLELN